MTTALFTHASRAAAAGRLDGAIAVARAAACAAPGATSTLELARVMASAGSFAAARAVLMPLVATDRDVATFVLAEVALQEGKLEEAVSLIQRHLATNPAARHLHYTLASVLPHLGRFNEANRHAARGTLITCGDFLQTSSRVIRFPESTREAPPPLSFARHVQHEPKPAPANTDAVYVVACDSRYFLLFAEALVSSLARCAKARLTLHLHLVNPNADAEALLRRLRITPGLPIICSREIVDFSTLTERQRRAYLSCARYLILPELFDRYTKPLLVADIDQLVVQDLTGLMRTLAEYDVGLLRDNRQIPNILALVSATLLALNHTPDARRFVRTLCDTITNRIADPAGLSWHLDQAGLAVAHLWHTEIRTWRLPLWIVDSAIDPILAPDAISPRALFWSITMTHAHTVRKLQTQLFRQFLSPDQDNTADGPVRAAVEQPVLDGPGIP